MYTEEYFDLMFVFLYGKTYLFIALTYWHTEWSGTSEKYKILLLLYCCQVPAWLHDSKQVNWFNKLLHHHIPSLIIEIIFHVQFIGKVFSKFYFLAPYFPVILTLILHSILLSFLILFIFPSITFTVNYSFWYLTTNYLLHLWISLSVTGAVIFPNAT